MFKKIFAILFLLASHFEITQQQTLYYSAFTSSTLSTVESWTITNSKTSPMITTCAGDQIIGGFNKFGDSATATVIVDLPAHYRIRITFDAYLIDSWDGESFQVYVDQTKGFDFPLSAWLTPNYLCGDSGLHDSKEAVSFEIDHNFRNAFIMITSTLDELADNESWGFRNFQLYIYECPSGCLICSNGESYSDCSVWSLAKSLQTSLDLSTFMVSLWTINPGSPTKHSCSMMPVICGPSRCGQGTQIYMTLSLPQHFRIKIRFKYIKLDTWRTGDYAYFQIDGVTKWTQELLLLPQYSQSVCGQTAVDLVLNVEFTVSHTATSTYLNLRNNLDEGYTVQAFAFRDFEIFTTMTKEAVASNTPIVCGDSVTQGSEDCDDGNLVPFDGCFFCTYSCCDGCLDCLYGECISCYPDWDFDSDNSICIYQQKNWNYQDFEQQCKDDNLTPFDGCFNNQYSCVYGCKECILGQCVFCEDGFEFNEINYSCEPICGDFILKADEQCDQNSPDCNQCQLKCSEFCSSCKNDVCQSCQTGYKLSANNQCEQIFEVKILNNLCSLTCKQCQDGVCLDCDNQDQELVGQCQDLTGETEQLKLCNVYQVGIDQQCEQSFKYEFENTLCQSSCNTCYNGICIECQDGYINILGQCQQICGDSLLALKTVLECQCDIECSDCKYGICSNCNLEFKLNKNKCDGICGNGITQVNEECDDGNNQEFDGCYNCKFSCTKGCVNCVLGQCFDQCNYGYYSNNGKCETMCGDQIIAGNEQCDDGNTAQIDGCFNCLFICPQYCKDCIEGVCTECQQGLTLTNNQCLNSCGDGNPFNEECDDGNLINGDGCSEQCNVEQDWVCQNGTFCLFSKYPQIVARFQDLRDSKQIVSLKFSQKVYQKLYTNYISNIDLSIKDLDESLYNIIIIEIQGAQYQEIKDVSYQLNVEFFTPIEYAPTLIIKLKESLYNEYDSPLQSNTANVILQKPNYISATQKKAAEALQVANESSVKSLFALSFILVILGDALSFMGILDILQEQSYLRFINVQYPQTILIYFESSKLVSLDSIFEFLSLSSFLDSIQAQFQVEQSYGKFRYYQIDANVMTNFIGEAIIFGSLFATLLCTNLLIKAIDHFQKSHILLKHPKIHKKIQQVQRQIYKIKVEIQKKGVKQTFFASSWDLILISFLQLQFYIHNYAQLNFQAIETSQTYFGIILSFCILGVGFYMISKYIRSVSFTKKRSLFSFWQKKGELFRYLKKFLILYILVFYQDHQEHQTLLLTFINIFYIIYVYTFKPCKTNQENYKTLAMEISKFMFFASTFTYWDILSNYFLHDDKVTISWIQIAILVSSILVFVVIEFYNLINLVVKKLTLYYQKYKKLPLETTPTSQADSNQPFTFKASQENIDNSQSENFKTIFKRQKILSARLSKSALRRKF